MDTPYQQWEKLKRTLGLTFAETIQRIDEIDKRTPWQSVEPAWWLEMMKERAQLTAAIAKAKGEANG